MHISSVVPSWGKPIENPRSQSPKGDKLPCHLLFVGLSEAVMHDSDSGIRIDSGMIPLLTGIGIGIKRLENSWNRNRNQAFRVDLESESESDFQCRPGIGIRIGIMKLPEL